VISVQCIQLHPSDVSPFLVFYSKVLVFGIQVVVLNISYKFILYSSPSCVGCNNKSNHSDEKAFIITALIYLKFVGCHALQLLRLNMLC